MRLWVDHPPHLNPILAVITAVLLTLENATYMSGIPSYYLYLTKILILTFLEFEFCVYYMMFCRSDDRETDTASEGSYQLSRHKKSPSSLTNLSSSSGMTSLSSVCKQRLCVNIPLLLPTLLCHAPAPVKWPFVIFLRFQGLESFVFYLTHN